MKKGLDDLLYTSSLKIKRVTQAVKSYTYHENKLTYYYKNGQIKAEGPFENNQMEGEWIFYRQSGQLWKLIKVK